MTWDDLARMRRALEGAIVDELGAEHAALAEVMATNLTAAIGASRNPADACSEAAHGVKEQLAENLAERLHDAVRRGLVRRVTG